MLTLVTGIWIILLLVLGTTPQGQAQPIAVDPASLVGEWHGTMMPRGGTGGRAAVRGGDYVLIISGVEGNVVRGKVVGPDKDSSGKLEGTIEKDTLHFAGGGGSRTQLTIKGESMEGIRLSGSGGTSGGKPREWAVSVSKKK